MTLPVSKYEELLETVRCLKRQTIRVRELASPLLDTIINANNTSTPAAPAAIIDDSSDDLLDDWGRQRRAGFRERDVCIEDYCGPGGRRSVSAMDSLLVEHQLYTDGGGTGAPGGGGISDDFRDSMNHVSTSSEPSAGPSGGTASLLFRGTWPGERISAAAAGTTTMWHSEPPPVTRCQTRQPALDDEASRTPPDVTSVMSFASSSGASPLDLVLNGNTNSSIEAQEARQRQQQQLEVKVDMVYSLLAVLGTHECPDMGETLLALSANPDSSRAMRQAGCLPVLVQLVYSRHEAGGTRDKAARALRNLVQGQSDERLRKRELKVLRLLDEIRTHCAQTDTSPEAETNSEASTPGETTAADETNAEATTSTVESEHSHPTQTTENIIKLSFDEGYRHTICELGGIYALAQLLEREHSSHGSSANSPSCITLRRYAGMALTNLTFGHGRNKALLCSFSGFLRCLVSQLDSTSDELRQVSASVLRNLSWRADAASRAALREAGAVTALMHAAMRSRREATLKSVLSALWNLSAHCSTNKADICAVPGALAFLVDMLAFRPPSRSLAIIENAGGILRNVSSHVAVREDYRAELRAHGCLPLLLQQLKSPSLTVVSNACGTLWNLSAKCAQDQRTLWDMGAAPMLRSLNHSKHVMIATGSRAALKNLLSSRPGHNLFSHVDSTARELGLPALPTLGARKQRALAKDLDQNLAETCDNIEPTSPPPHTICSPVLSPTAPPTIQAANIPSPPAAATGTCVATRRRRPLPDEQIVDAFSSLTLSDSCPKITDTSTPDSMHFPRKTHQHDNYDAFSSLTLNDSCPKIADTTTPDSIHFSRKMHQHDNYSTHTSSTYIRSNYSDFDYEQDSVEQPVDYSQKYSETKLLSAKDPKCAPDPKPKKDSAGDAYVYRNKCANPPPYSDYAETDLDQPTDYSLRYAENDSDSEDICKNEPPMTSSLYEGQQDTVKTYCTEGTPYETPYNFSTATSMSDLRIDSNTDLVIKPELVDNKKKRESCDAEISNPNFVTRTNNLNTDSIRCEITDKKSKSTFSSGLMTPEKPVNYCEEGTPRCFSRVSSFSSLNMDEPGAERKHADGDIIKRSPAGDTAETDVVDTGAVKTENDSKMEREEAAAGGKVVTFGSVVDCAAVASAAAAEETPLMFSRCSSLGSLSSAEQHSIHDDRSSVVSDFSRLTSGIVSPSELPDSPTQTVPPSPRHRKAPLDFPNICAPEPLPKPVQKSVFEDNVIKFKEVNTPVEFSTNTSLSSLTIDDEPNVQVFNLIQAATNSAPGNQQNNGVDEVVKSSPSSREIVEDIEADAAGTVDEQAEDDMLAACINIGMQNNRHRQKKQQQQQQQSSLKHKSAIPTIPGSKYQSSLRGMPQRSGIPMKTPVSGVTGTPTKSSDSRLPLPTRSIDLNSDTTRTYCTEDTPAMLSHAGSHSDLSVLSIASSRNPPATPGTADEKPELSDCKHETSNYKLSDDKPELSDDSSNLSGDNDNILAECIQSGMPKARRAVIVPKPITPKSSTPRSLTAPRGLATPGSLQQRILKNASAYVPPAAKDEMERYAVEDSPCHFSLRSSLSDLTIDGANTPAAANSRLHSHDPPATTSPEQRHFANAADASGDLSSVHLREERPVLSRAESLSSLSVESFGSTENAEQALLEQCISSGMPKSKEAHVPKNGQVASVALDAEAATWARPWWPPPGVTDVTLPGDGALAAARDTADTRPRPAIRSTSSGSESPSQQPHQQKQHITEVESDKLSVTLEDNLLTQETKSGHDVVDKCSDLLDGSIEDNNASPDWSDTERNQPANRMLDPDAMIESLDRFTAELVSQSSHLQQHQLPQHECKLDNVMQQSGNECGGGDTWNDDTSPNDVSFPSISVSVPLAASFRSESDNNPTPATTLSDSTLIAIEATKIVDVVRAEADMFHSSVTSLDIEQIKPPSVMDSLVSLTSSASIWSDTGQQQQTAACNDSSKFSPVPHRKKSLPAGLMVRRALSISSQHVVRSSENLNVNQNSTTNLMMITSDNASSISSSCNLEHVKPPSVMGGDYLDLVDMENSMVSVASITSEVADETITKQPDRFADILASSVAQCHSITDIEHVNPPSLLNEVTELCSSTADLATDNMYSETEVFEDCITHTIENTLRAGDDTITEYSDANSVTPVQSDFATSSAESTPKKVRNLNRMTPKQRRQLAKERYKTYTVAAEMVIREECKANKTLENQLSSDVDSAITGSEVDPVDNNNSSSESNYATASAAKLTPKERRQLDRARFQTRVLDGTFLPNMSPEPANSAEDNQQQQVSRPSSRTDVRKVLRQRRLENRERFRTRTLSSSDGDGLGGTTDDPNIDELHLVLAQQANIVLDTLHADELLDCETLSLVSNEDDSEHNSVSSVNYRTYHKSWGFSKNLPVVRSVCADAELPANGVADGRSSQCSEREQAEEERPDSDPASDNEEASLPKCAKPKIVKPADKGPLDDTVNEVEVEQEKAIRGRRKALYTPPGKRQIPASKFISKNIKPVKTVTSNLVKNVTSALKTNTVTKPKQQSANRPGETVKPQQIIQSKIGRSQLPAAPKSKIATKSSYTPKPPVPSPAPKSLERQGTFTKDEKKPKVPESRIPMAPAKTNRPTAPAKSGISRPVQSKIVSSTTTNGNSDSQPSKLTKYGRSPSADRDFGFRGRKPPVGMHGSTSSQSLQGTDAANRASAIKRSSIPNMTQRSNSNTSITSSESSRKRPVTSRIACLWKRNSASSETEKPAQQKPNKASNGVQLRTRNHANNNQSADPAKRLSRLGSFIQVEEIPVT